MRRIALMTDFGTRDPYVAAMKGVLASRTDAPVIDLTHDIAPFDVLEGAWFLATVVAYWPEGTIFMCVVDPGVGTARRIVAVEKEGRVFLAPDNGLLTLVLEDNNPSSACGTFSPHEGRRQPGDEWPSPLRRGEKVPQADEGSSFFSVETESLFLPTTSTTFHGRDRFAPVAAALANGMPLADVGPRIDRIVTLDYERPSYGHDEVRGTVVAIDRFGNVITDIETACVPFARYVMQIGGHTIDRVERNYGDAAAGAFLIAGSTGHLEISIANASAAEQLGAKRLQRVELRRL